MVTPFGSGPALGARRGARRIPGRSGVAADAFLLELAEPAKGKSTAIARSDADRAQRIRRWVAESSDKVPGFGDTRGRRRVT
ncbi:MAG: hypothetical protein ACQGVK_15505 [Myxococcota bacterium]